MGRGGDRQSEHEPNREAYTGQHADSTGSLGIAISEAVEEAATRPDTNYALGSVLNHVLLHQTVIGLETKKQFEKVGDYPDVIIACCGGGSNFGGVAFPFFADKAAGEQIRLIAVEPESCPTLTRGHYAYDSGDTEGLTPLMLMYTLGRNFVPPSIHAGGLRYHGDSPLVSQLHHEGLIEAVAVPQRATFEAGLTFSRTEGIIPAPESNHAIRVAIDEALKCKRTGERRRCSSTFLVTAISTWRRTTAICAATGGLRVSRSGDKSGAGEPFPITPENDSPKITAIRAVEAKHVEERSTECSSPILPLD